MTTTKPKMTATRTMIGTTVQVQFRITDADGTGRYDKSLIDLVTGCGWTKLAGELVSPICRTAAEIDAARPVALRSLVTV